MDKVKNNMKNNINKNNTKSGLTMLMIVGLLAVFAIFLAGCEKVPVYPPTTIPTTTTGGENIVLAQGTYQEPTIFEPTLDVKTKNFKTDQEFSDFVNANAGGNSYYGYYGGGVMMEKALSSASFDSSLGSARATASGAPSAAPTAVNAENGNVAHSETNNQVEGVDEADIIKNDGQYIYSISGNTVYIVNAYPGENASIISTLKFKSAPSGVFISKDYMAVFGDFTELDYFKDMNFKPRQGITFFNIYDIKDRANPKLVKEYKFEGRYFQARMMGDYVYFVTNTMPEVRRDYPTPIMMDGTTITSMPVKDIYYFDIPYSSVQFATVHSINLEDLSQSVNSKTVAVESSQNMYMSDKNIYITYTEYINEWEIRNKIIIDQMQDQLTDSDKEVVAKIKATDNEVLSQQEKESKILNIIYSYINFMTQTEQQDFNDKVDAATQAKLDTYDYMEYTVINKVGVSNGQITVQANGKVPGHVNNQFSMDEKNDVLRIATTISQQYRYFNGETKNTDSSNNVFTLDKDLKIMDSLKDLAKGEQIYSTRFMDNRLYMVTFRQVDPFFVIDLSNPSNIKELGTLKIPGFSRYLHPYDENTIIGIGRDASATGQQRGLKISIFDVTDVEHPKETAKFVTDEQYAQSTAEFEHKAFLFSQAKDLLVIPAYSYNYRPCWGDICPAYEGTTAYNGAFVFNITKTSIELRGIIDHGASNKNNYYGSLVERSLYIGDDLYTKSEGLLRINKISDLSKVKNIEFADSNNPYPVY